MQGRRSRWVGIAPALALALALGNIGGLRAQNPPAKKATGKAPSKVRNQGGVPLKKAKPEAADPLARPKDEAPLGSFHYRFKLGPFDFAETKTTLITKYYPSRLGLTAPVILMVHEKDRSGKDFEDPIPDLKGRGLAEHLQAQGYAVLIPDLRGQGANPRRSLTAKDWRLMIDDLQAAYQFLLDRHNRGELNVAKLGVLAAGEGANLAAAWLATPGAAVSSEGRASGDAAALALVSPMPEGQGFRLAQVVGQLANRLPIEIVVGERDPASADPVRGILGILRRGQQNKVEFKNSPLHGYKLLKLESQVTTDLARFFDGTIKYKVSEWEPRYNLRPVACLEIQVVPNARAADAEPAKKEAEPAPAKKEAERPKAK